MSDRQVVFLLDVDNTLLDNDRVIADLREYLEREIGHEWEARYWVNFEELRKELGYADYLGALQRTRSEYPHDTQMMAVSRFLLGYPFETRLFPGALDVVARLSRLGRAVVLTDGDVVFQPLKVERSGLFAAVGGRVLIYVHKEEELAEVERSYPASHYVLVDDKLRILTRIKAAWGERVTTVFPRQGHYAHDPLVLERYPPADLTVERIGELLEVEPAVLLGGS